ncbi:hypothetical protein [Sulfurimonas sp.]|uniref:hypothetical protein n=1 Tax=Sulfurimonas sp. TaxID=2022749 RepID=UPI002AB0FF42|nr:hypothetical protein [Sulfurimonas sp.]
MYFSMTLFLFAYELPELKLPKNNQPEIVVFDTQSLLVNDKRSYKIRWKTINATDVNITFIGKVELEGSFTITEDEYNRGPITLMASSKTSSYVDEKTINKNSSSKVITPIFQSKEEEDAYYNTTMPYRRRMYNPARRQRRYY